MFPTNAKYIDNLIKTNKIIIYISQNNREYLQWIGRVLTKAREKGTN